MFLSGSGFIASRVAVDPGETAAASFLGDRWRPRLASHSPGPVRTLALRRAPWEPGSVTSHGSHKTNPLRPLPPAAQGSASRRTRRSIFWGSPRAVCAPTSLRLPVTPRRHASRPTRKAQLTTPAASAAPTAKRSPRSRHQRGGREGRGLAWSGEQGRCAPGLPALSSTLSSRATRRRSEIVLSLRPPQPPPHPTPRRGHGHVRQEPVRRRRRWGGHERAAEPRSRSPRKLRAAGSHVRCFPFEKRDAP